MTTMIRKVQKSGVPRNPQEHLGETRLSLPPADEFAAREHKELKDNPLIDELRGA